MKVESYNFRGEKRFMVGDASLTHEQATSLRDALTRELGSPQALTDGERAVWAAAFERELAKGYDPVQCARDAARAVAGLRDALADADRIGDPDARLMLLAMTGGGR